jgi:para-nitrobenzyl esterase
MQPKTVELHDESQCREIDAFLADRIYEFNVEATGNAGERTPGRAPRRPMKTASILLAFALLAACAAAPLRLGGTAWQLVGFQGGDGKTLTPDDRAKYTIEFLADGAVAMRIDCNRARGAWKSPQPGQLQFGPLAVTRVLCPPDPLNDRFAKDVGYVRSYVVRNGRLFLSLMADGGIYEFEPRAP